MANHKDEILELERRFWTGDADFYKENLDAECLIAFTEMAGVMTNEEVAGTVGSGNRWKNLDLKVKGLLEPALDVALLGYERARSATPAKPIPRWSVRAMSAGTVAGR